MDYCDLRSLADKLNDCRKENKPAFKEWDLFIQLANAVAYCHYAIHDAVFQPNGRRDSPWIGVVHRDIKTANVFLRSNYRSGFLYAVLGGFGCHCRTAIKTSLPLVGKPGSSKAEGTRYAMVFLYNTSHMTSGISLLNITPKIVNSQVLLWKISFAAPDENEISFLSPKSASSSKPRSTQKMQLYNSLQLSPKSMEINSIPEGS